MTEKIDENIIGFFASFNASETDQELVKDYLWSDSGLKNKLAHLKWKNYGQGGYFGSFCATHFGVIVPGISV
jgi:hypothetical protein